MKLKTLLIISLLFPVAAFADDSLIDPGIWEDAFANATKPTNTETIVVIQPQQPTYLDSALKEKALNGEYESRTSGVIRRGMAYHLDQPVGYNYKGNK